MTIKLANKIISGSSTPPKPVHEVTPVDAQSLGVALSTIAGGDEVEAVLPHDIDTESVRKTISVSVDLMQRLYSGMYILYQTITPANYGPETPAILEQVLRTKLIEPLSRTFPDMANFEFTVTMKDDSIIVAGGNVFSNTLLHAINESIHAPVAEIEADYIDDDDSDSDPYPM